MQKQPQMDKRPVLALSCTGPRPCRTLSPLDTGQRAGQGQYRVGQNKAPVPVHDKCPACDGSGWVERHDGYLGLDHVTMVPCPDTAGVHRAAEIERLSRISGLLPEELALRLDDVSERGNTSGIETLSVEELVQRQDTAAMLELARRFVEEPRGFLILHGRYGNAKTLIVQAVVNEFRERHGVVGTYVRMHDLLEHVRAGYAPNAEDDARARYERLKSLPILAIDEFDAARMTDFAYEFRTAFLDDRYRLAVTRRAHTLFAMNCDPAELPGDLYDRLRDGRFVVFHNADVSMRPAMAW
jgi:hypothetical protein